jgi:hypothetical protein
MRIKKRLTLTTVLLAAALASSLLVGPAHADVTYASTALERQFKKVSFTYVRACPSCDSTWYAPGTTVATASGDVDVRVSTYRRKDENPDTEIFFVDVSIDITNRTGDEDWGWMDVTVKSTGDVMAKDVTYTSGVSATNKDTKTDYPITLGVGFGPFSAGTTVAHFTTETKGSNITRDDVSRGQAYTINKVNGTYHATMARFVRVAQGKFPTFSVDISANHDSGKVTCAQWADGLHCWVPRGFVTRSVDIGTAP